MRILIFGGLGYLGSHLKKVLKKKHKLLILTNKKYQKKTNYRSGVKSVAYTTENLRKTFENFKPDKIIFMSGNSNPATSKNHYYDLIRTNLYLQNVLDAMKQTAFGGGFYFASSIAVYGNKVKSGLVSENDSSPSNYYGLSKLLAENQIKFYTSICSFKSCIFRMATFFGPGLQKQFFFEFIKKIKKNKKKIVLKGSIKDKRDLLYIDDLVKILIKLLFLKQNKKFEIYNVGSGKEHFIKDIVLDVLKILNFNTKIIYKNLGRAPHFPKMSIKKLKNRINFKSNKKFNYYLKKVVSDYNKIL